MAREHGFLQRLKICWWFLRLPRYKNVQVMSCEYCGSTNIIKTHVYAATQENVYTAEYACMGCKAKCAETQLWSKRTPEQIAELKRQIAAK